MTCTSTHYYSWQGKLYAIHVIKSEPIRITSYLLKRESSKLNLGKRFHHFVAEARRTGIVFVAKAATELSVALQRLGGPQNVCHVCQSVSQSILPCYYNYTAARTTLLFVFSLYRSFLGTFTDILDRSTRRKQVHFLFLYP